MTPASQEIAEIMSFAVLTEQERLRLSELIPLERREQERDGRLAALVACPFKVDDRVLHKSGGSTKRGADARVGVVKRIYTVRGKSCYVTKLSVDWPAPRRINGDGWHRSDVLASAVIPATDTEIERRRGLNRALVARRGY
jgi:hypothetical protein